ncbi:Ig-like domain repeat protein [Nakamurella lactea]|uniref:Ig-like domain repeat protein n=1 Tax=Nakamurella lactea TaxID=459515 RepID=UPI00041C64B4|nr:Ig-like domain repeat protein [Nakamurella lactea]
MQTVVDQTRRTVRRPRRTRSALSLGAAIAVAAGVILAAPVGAAPVAVAPAAATLAKVGTTATVTPQSTVIPFGKRTTVQVKISNNASGSVTLRAGSTVVGTKSLSGGAATFALPTSLSVGRHTLTATYAGNSSYGASSASKAVDVIKSHPGGFAVTLLPSTVVGSQQTTVRVKVVGAGATVTGAVRILVNGTARAAFSLRNGTGEVKVPRLAPGSYAINARYDGDSHFAQTVSGTVRLNVKATSSTSPSPTRNPVPYGTALPVTVKVTASGVSSPKGSVSLAANGHSIGTKALSSGQAKFSVGLAFNPGRYTLNAKYTGEARATASAGVKAFDVIKARPGVGISLSASTVKTTQRVRVNTAVSGGPAASAGTVKFLVDGVNRGSKPLKSGRAAIDLPTLSAGTHRVVVSYGGDARYTPAVSGTATITVTAPFVNGCSGAARACVDLTHNLTWIQQNGRIIYGPVPMLSGRPGYRTSAGMFSVYWKDIDHKSSIFDDAPMPYAIFFDGGTAFHEGSLYVLSHGCIHLSHSAATYYWNALDYGDTVHVFGYGPY